MRTSTEIEGPEVSITVRQNFYSVRIVNLWNKLPESVVKSSSVNVFKKRLDDWIADVDF